MKTATEKKQLFGVPALGIILACAPGVGKNILGVFLACAPGVGENILGVFLAKNAFATNVRYRLPLRCFNVPKDVILTNGNVSTDVILRA